MAVEITNPTANADDYISSMLASVSLLSEYKHKITILDVGAGVYFDITDVTTNFTLTSQRLNSATTLDLEYLMDEMEIPPFEEGAVVTITVNAMIIFIGYVFTTSRNRWGVCRLNAYDSIRYLKNPIQIYRKEGYDGNKLMQEAALECGITLKLNINSKYSWASKPYIEYNKPALDIIMEILNRSVVSGNTDEAFTMQVDYKTGGKVVAINPASKNKKRCIIGDKSLLTDINIERSIDNDWCNSFYIIYAAGTTDIPMMRYEVRNEASITRRGLVRMSQEADQQMFFNIAKSQKFGDVQGDDSESNEAFNKTKTFIEDWAKKSAVFYNAMVYNIRLECLGFLGVRAGDYVKLDIKGFEAVRGDGEVLQNYILLDTVTHQFQEGVHTMSLDAKVNVPDDGALIGK